MDRFPAVMADGIRLKWIVGINSVSQPASTGLPDLLTSKNFAMLSCTPGKSANFQTPNNGSDLPGSFAGEAARFGNACFESLIEVPPPPGLERSLGWPLIRAYYAAFFAAHALLRLCGESVTFLSTSNANRLNQIGQIYLGVSPEFTKGLYHLKATQNGRLLQLTQIKGSGGGSHEELWKLFFNFLTDVENKLALTSSSLPEAIVAIQTSQTMRAALSRNNCSSGSWLSQSRNSINYQHEYGIWFPYQIRRNQANVLISTFDHWKHETADWASRFQVADSALMHLNLSQAIAAILTCTLKDIVKRNTAKKSSFVDRLPFALVRLHIPGW